MAAAWRHYQSLEYDQALASLTDARRTATTPGQLAEVLMLEGFVQTALERNDEALQLFRQVLRTAPGYRLPANTSPKIGNIFEHARTLERERARHRAEVTVELAPPASPEVAARAVDVVVAVTHAFPELSGRLHVENVRDHTRTQLPLQAEPDGRWRARIPAELIEADGELSLRAELVHEGEVVASSPAAKDAAVHLLMPRYTAALRIESPMIGAVVRVDGVEIGRVPVARLIPVAPGRRHLELEGDKGIIAQAVEVSAGEVTRVTLKVEARSRLPIARYFLIGLGSALLVTGGVLFDQSQRADAQYHALVVRDPVTNLPVNPYSTAAPQANSARAFQIAAGVAVSVGGAATIVGLALFAVRDPRAKKRLALGREGAGVRF